jgi:AAA15 family ATPase/GTPase
MPLIENLQITHFKCFKQLEVNGLGQVNLIGGKNNVGKTAFLEAVELFASANKAYDLAYLISNTLERRQSNRRRELRELRELIDLDFFYNGESDITLASTTKTCAIKSSFEIFNAEPTNGRFSSDETNNILPTDILTISVNNDTKKIPMDRLFRMGTIRTMGKNPDRKLFISSSKSDEQDIAISFGALIELGREDFLKTALSSFDDNICELKAIPIQQGFILKLRLNNQNNLVLLSSLGEGINRYIAILCAIWANKDGFLLIDEIENGIHYTNYKKLWEIIFNASVDANCQLFITTHSKECITAFNDMQFAIDTCNAQYFEFYRNLKTDLIVASSRDKEQLQYALTHEGRIRGE